MANFQFTSESVTCGHPDKICDQISDAVLDAALSQDQNARVAVETGVKTGMVICFGEMRTKAWVDIEKTVRQVIRDIGYTSADYGFGADSVAVLSAIGNQSDEIAQGVDRDSDLGAGDQGMMFGYACHETAELMPLPITLAHRLTRRLETVRQSGECPFLRPDGKAQVTVAYDGQRRAQTVTAVVLSAQHHPDIGQDALKSALKQAVITPVLGDLITAETVFHINPTGSFVVGGPQGDAGLTGRKIIVDTYGGSCPHGGGAFSGKDATKVDRTGAYAARHIAKNIVAAGLAERCQVQVSYAIGVAEPVSLLIESFGTGEVDDRLLEKAVLTLWDLRPAALIHQLDLKQPVFQKTASGGHFGRPEFAWESLTHVPRLKAYFA